MKLSHCFLGIFFFALNISAMDKNSSEGPEHPCNLGFIITSLEQEMTSEELYNLDSCSEMMVSKLGHLYEEFKQYKLHQHKLQEKWVKYRCTLEKNAKHPKCQKYIEGGYKFPNIWKKQK